jgi:hypothetical protein
MFCMSEYVGNYKKKKKNGNVDGADMLEGVGMLNFLNIYVQQTTVNASLHSVGNSWFWCPVSLVVHEQFLSKLSICRPNLYWSMVLIS